MPETINGGVSLFQLQVSGYDTLADLRTRPPADNPNWTKRGIAVVFGQNSAFDGQYLWYSWNPTDTRAEAGVRIIKPDSIVGSGRWNLSNGFGTVFNSLACACAPGASQYDCVDGLCTPVETGEFLSLEECEAMCSPPPSLFGRCDGTWATPGYSTTSDRLVAVNIAQVPGTWNDRLIKAFKPQYTGVGIVPHTGASGSSVWYPVSNKFYVGLAGGPAGAAGFEMIAVVDPDTLATTYIGGFPNPVGTAFAGGGVYIAATGRIWFQVSNMGGNNVFAIINPADDTFTLLASATLNGMSGFIYDPALETIFVNKTGLLYPVDVNTQAIGAAIDLSPFFETFWGKTALSLEFTAMEYIPATDRLWLGYVVNWTSGPPFNEEGYCIVNPNTGTVETDYWYDHSNDDPPTVITYSSQFNVVLVQLDPLGAFPRDFGFHVVPVTGGAVNSPFPKWPIELDAQGVDVTSVNRFGVPAHYLGDLETCLYYFSAEELLGDTQPTFNCLDNSCVDPNDGSGATPSLLTCEATCALPPPVTYDCVEFNCVDPGTGGGQFATLEECQASCIAPCEFSIDPTSDSVAASPGGSGTVNLTASAPDCEWSAVSNDPWITVTGFTGLGSGTVDYTYDENLGGSGRVGTITIAGLTFTLNQAGAAPPSITTPTEWWKMDETSDTATIVNRVGQILGVRLEPDSPGIASGTGLINNSATWAQFYNKNFFAALADWGLLPYTIGQDISISFWFQNTTADDDVSAVPFVGLHIGANFGSRGFSIASYSSGANDILYAEAYNGTDDGYAEATISPLTLGQWYHVVGVYHAGTGVADFYLNTVLKGTTTPSCVLPTDATCPFSIEGTTMEARSVDEVGLWIGHALDAGEISALYNAGAGVTYPF